VCFKMHHSAVDDLTSLGIVNALHDLTPDTAPVPVDKWTPKAHPSSLNLLARTLVTYARRPAQFVSAAKHSIPVLIRLPAAMNRYRGADRVHSYILSKFSVTAHMAWCRNEPGGGSWRAGLRPCLYAG